MIYQDTPKYGTVCLIRWITPYVETNYDDALCTSGGNQPIISSALHSTVLTWSMGSMVKENSLIRFLRLMMGCKASKGCKRTKFMWDMVMFIVVLRQIGSR